MKIAFDEYAFCMQQYGGVSRYFTRLAEQLAELEQTVKIFAPLHRNHYLDRLPRQLVKGYRINNYPPKTTRLAMPLNRLWNKAAINVWRPDVVHETFYSRHRVASRKTPTVITIHDMIHELFPEEFPRNDQTSRAKKVAAMRADHIICISENTRKDLISLFGIPEEKISVVYHGIDCVAPVGTEITYPSPDQPFILYVGVRNQYKNFGRLLHAISSSPQLKKDFKIIAFGGGPFSPLEENLICKSGFSPGQIIHVKGSDDILARLYTTATAFVYPSLYEGFGFPPLEAMAHNCPVISSNASCLPEIIGNAADFFDPRNEESIASAIAAVVYSESRRQELIRKGQSLITHFSWDKCAMETLAVYRRITSKT